MHSAHTSLTAESLLSSLHSFACSSSIKGPYSSMVSTCPEFLAPTFGNTASSPSPKIRSSFRKVAFDLTSICLETVRMNRSLLYCVMPSYGECFVGPIPLNAAFLPLRWEHCLHSRLDSVNFYLLLAASLNFKSFLEPTRNQSFFWTRRQLPWMPGPNNSSIN